MFLDSDSLLISIIFDIYACFIFIAKLCHRIIQSNMFYIVQWDQLILCLYQNYFMRRLLPLLLLALLYSGAHSEYLLHKHPADSSARCLDGSPSALYVSEGDTNNFLIYFEGGGMCSGMTLEQTLSDCVQRSKTALGSSKFYEPIVDLADFTIMSNLKKVNPLYYNWTKVLVPYCDGVLHQGTRKSEISYQGTTLFFRGMNNTLQHFQYLNQKYRLFSAKNIVLSGTSAGALAAMAWSNTVYKQAVNKEGVYVVSDSGLFVSDFLNPFTNSTPGIDLYKQIKAIAFVENDPPLAQCLAADTKQNCDKFRVAINYVIPPVFAIVSEYDLFALKYIVQLRCTQKSFPATLQKCNSTEMAVIEDYRQQTLESLKSLTKYTKNGLWAVSCSQHGFLYQSSFYDGSSFEVPSGSGNTILSALTQFMQKKPAVYSDTVSWPNNQGCSGVGSLNMEVI